MLGEKGYVGEGISKVLVLKRYGGCVCERERVCVCECTLGRCGPFLWPGFCCVGLMGFVWGKLFWVKNAVEARHSLGVAYLRGQSLDFPRACLENYLGRPSLAVTRGIRSVCLSVCPVDWVLVVRFLCG